jgi:rhamnosyltransferase
MNSLVSIIIRTRNEERWIKHCLEAVYDQDYKNFEVIIVDNKSTDGTIQKASKFPVKLTHLEKYLPGHSLNFGIEQSKGDILVFLSGHCIPADKVWLSQLVKNLNDPKIAGVYGRQLPMSFTSPYDKRDLLITFGLDEKIQKKDCFFHNANSAIKREVWKKIPFDNEVTNIEDRIWAQQVLKSGYYIKYTPDAAVYHYHGIHHGGSEERALNTLKVMEKFSYKNEQEGPGELPKDKMEIVAFIPVKGTELSETQTLLLERTIQFANSSKSIKKSVAIVESPEVAKYALEKGATAAIIRDESLAKEYIDLSMLYEKMLPTIEEADIHPDLIVSLEPNYLLRPEGLVDSLVDELLKKGYDSIVPTYLEYNATWNSENNNRLDNGEVPRAQKSPLHITDKGLGLVLYPELIRYGQLYGPKLGRYVIENKFSKIEIRDNKDLGSIKELLSVLSTLKI